MTCLNRPCCSAVEDDFDFVSDYFRGLAVPFHIEKGEERGWRFRSKLAIRGTFSVPLIGLFKEGTHEVYEIPTCRAHHPLINQAVAYIKKWITESRLELFREEGSLRGLRYLQLVVERGTLRVQVSFVIAEEESVKALGFWSEAVEKLLKMTPPGFWHSAWLNFNRSPLNAIFGASWRLVFGEKWLIDSIRGFRLFYLPGSFGQANPVLFERLISELVDLVDEGQAVAEFFAGIGAMGIALAEKSKRVILNEVNPLSKECFDESAAHLLGETRSKLSYHLGSASFDLSLLEEADVVIVDPPRKGLEKPFLFALNASKRPQQLIYVSCGFSALTRDLALLQKGGWRCEKATGYLLFPGTDHLETLVSLERIKA